MPKQNIQGGSQSVSNKAHEVEGRRRRAVAAPPPSFLSNKFRVARGATSSSAVDCKGK